MSEKNRKPFANLDSVEAKEIKWLWEPLIPYGMITIMEGDPGVGKSYLAMHLAAQVSIGGELPGDQRADQGRVLYLSAEDDAAYTIRPRIDAMKGDPSKIRIQADYLSLDPQGLETLKKEVKRKPPRLLVMDPLFAYMPSGQDMYRSNVVRPLLSFLKDIAEQGETAILIVRHLTKAKHDKAIYQGGGSMDVIGAARSAFRVATHPEDETQKLVLHIKHNIAVRGQTWAYELSTKKNSQIAVLKWTGPCDITIDDLMSHENDRNPSALDIAIEFLKDFLKDGPKLSRVVKSQGEARGHSAKTLERARKAIGIITKKKKKGWKLSLPP